MVSLGKKFKWEKKEEHYSKKGEKALKMQLFGLLENGRLGKNIKISS